MTAVVLTGGGGIGPTTKNSMFTIISINSTFTREFSSSYTFSATEFSKDIRLKNITSMKKIDLFSLFFFDPLHPTFDDIYTSKSSPIITTEALESPKETNCTQPAPSEISSEDHTDPDLSTDESLHDEVDTSSNVTEGEMEWCAWEEDYPEVCIILN